ncbi:MAG: spore coat associated protein CotJA, partial [Clostridia bacterium]|nr:spore coat associated protein CotJA [Clostridia bacterium]
TCRCGEIVAAGGVCAAGCTAVDEPANDCSMAVICCPVQTYVAGYCPAEALQNGTLFPELVNPYTRGC